MRPFRDCQSAITLLCTLLVLSLMAGCAPRNGGVANSDFTQSTEFRLRSLEAKFLELERRQSQLEQQAVQRVASLEEIVADYRGQIEILRSMLGETMAYSSSAQIPPAPRPKTVARPATKPARKTTPKSTPKSATKAAAKTTPAPTSKSTPKPTPKRTASTSEKAPAPAPPVPPASAAPSAQSEQAGQKLYEQALVRIRAGKTAEAIPMLERFVKENPKSQLVPDAYFRIGEAYFQAGEYDQAILAYKEIAGSHPGHAKAPESMLKIGYAYENLGDMNNARFYLQALMDEFPGTASATLASQKISQLGN